MVIHQDFIIYIKVPLLFVIQDLFATLYSLLHFQLTFQIITFSFHIIQVTPIAFPFTFLLVLFTFFFLQVQPAFSFLLKSIDFFLLLPSFFSFLHSIFLISVCLRSFFVFFFHLKFFVLQFTFQLVFFLLRTFLVLSSFLVLQAFASFIIFQSFPFQLNQFMFIVILLFFHLLFSYIFA